MTQLQIPGDNFEERLLTRLKAEVAERGATEEAPATGATVAPAWRRRTSRWVLGAAATAASAVTVMLALSAGDGTPAAFAVEAQPEGYVSVEIRSLEDAKGLEEKLDEAGIPASVSYLAAGMSCKEARFRAVPWPDGSRAIVSGPGSGGGPFVFSVSRDAVGPGQMLVITASPSPPDPFRAQVKVAEGTVAPCEPSLEESGT
ncbi:MAG: hypothetical protein ACM3N0_10175 [Chloroflexota bacterium]